MRGREGDIYSMYKRAFSKDQSQPHEKDEHPYTYERDENPYPLEKEETGKVTYSFWHILKDLPFWDILMF